MVHDIAVAAHIYAPVPALLRVENKLRSRVIRAKEIIAVDPNVARCTIVRCQDSESHSAQKDMCNTRLTLVSTMARTACGRVFTECCDTVKHTSQQATVPSRRRRGETEGETE